MGMQSLPASDQYLPGRAEQMPVIASHVVLNTALKAPFAENLEQIVLGMGCFWGAERLFWGLPGVHTTAAGYAGGRTPNPGYEEVCSGLTGHTEVVLVVFDPLLLDLSKVLALFWESHDPSQGMRQGNDMGTQYRSAIYTTSNEQATKVAESRESYQMALSAVGHAQITTEISALTEFYYAEDYHQQYLHKVPNGYCGLAGTGVCMASREGSV